MSQRSILEINHDYAARILQKPATFMDLLARALASGSDESWVPLEFFGVRRIVQVHHSAERKVVLKIAGQDVEYTFG